MQWLEKVGNGSWFWAVLLLCMALYASGHIVSLVVDGHGPAPALGLMGNALLAAVCIGQLIRVRRRGRRSDG